MIYLKVVYSNLVHFQICRLNKIKTVMFGYISIITFVHCSCSEMDNDKNYTQQNLANTQWVLEYIQTPDKILYPGDDFFSIKFIGEDSIATFPDSSLNRKSCVVCFGNYKITMPDSIQFSWMCNFVGRPPDQCSGDIGFNMYYVLTSSVYAFHRDEQMLELFSKSDTTENTNILHFNIY